MAKCFWNCKGCTVVDIMEKSTNNQCSVILCNPRKVTSSREAITPWTARLQQVFSICTITYGPTWQLQHTLCSASGGQLVTSAIQPRSGAEFHALKDHLSGHKFASYDDMTAAVMCTKIAGHRILRAGMNRQSGQGPQS